MKKILHLMLAVIFLFPSVILAQEEPPVRVQLNGNYIDFDVPPVMIDDRLMVPFRTVAENMAVEVAFDAEKQQITATKDSCVMTFIIGSVSAEVQDEDGIRTITMDTPPVIAEERTLVPLRFFAEAFGLDVAWVDYSNTAVLIDYSIFTEQIKNEAPNFYKTIGLLHASTNVHQTITQNYEAAFDSKTFGVHLNAGLSVNADIRMDGDKAKGNVSISGSGLSNLYSLILQQMMQYENSYDSDEQPLTFDFDHPAEIGFMINENAAYVKSPYISGMLFQDYDYYYLDPEYTESLYDKWIEFPSSKEQKVNKLSDIDQIDSDKKLRYMLKGFSGDYSDILDILTNPSSLRYELFDSDNYYMQFKFDSLKQTVDILTKVFSDEKLILQEHGDGAYQITYAVDDKGLYDIILQQVSSFYGETEKENIMQEVNRYFDILHMNVAYSAAIQNGTILNSSITGSVKMDNFPNPYKLQIGSLDCKFNISSTSSEIGSVVIPDTDFPTDSDKVNKEEIDKKASEAKTKHYRESGYFVDDEGNVDFGGYTKDY